MNAITPNPTGQRPHSGPLVIQSAFAQQPEPGFIDLVFTLWRYRTTLLVCTVLGALAGVALAMALPRAHAYTTIIQIGSADPAGLQPIEPPESAIAKMTKAWMPAIEREHGQTTGNPGFTSGITITNPKGTALLVLNSKATAEQESDQVQLHRQLSDRLLTDHRREIELTRTTFTLELEGAKRSAAALKDKSASLTVRRALLLEKRTFTEQRLSDIEQEIDRIAANRESAGRNIGGQEQVLTVMMVDLQVAREKEKRDELKRLLTLGIAEETDQLKREESDLVRAQQDQDGHITAIQARIAHLAETRLVGEPQRSQQPVGLGGPLLVAVATLIGMALGVVGALSLQALQGRDSTGPR